MLLKRIPNAEYQAIQRQLILPDPFVSPGEKGGIEDGSIVCPDYQEIEIDP